MKTSLFAEAKRAGALPEPEYLASPCGSRLLELQAPGSSNLLNVMEWGSNRLLKLNLARSELLPSPQSPWLREHRSVLAASETRYLGDILDFSSSPTHI